MTPARVTPSVTDPDDQVIDVSATGSIGESAADSVREGWTIELAVRPKPGHDRVAASLLALSDGTVSVIGDIDGADDPTHLVLATGAYGAGPDGLVRPLPGPAWTTLDDVGTTWGTWRLDLHSGVLSSINAEGVHVTRFQSIARPGIGCLRVEHAPQSHPGSELRCDGDESPSLDAPTIDERGVGDRANGCGPTLLRPPTMPGPLAAIHRYEQGEPRADGTECAATVSERAAVTVAVAEQSPGHGTRDRFAAVLAGRVPQCTAAGAAVSDARRAGYDQLLDEHRRAWADRWDGADIEITGDLDAQRAVRYALFHLLSCASTNDESPVGARGLTGLAYAGHVFWDTDVFVLPALAATLPAAARSIVEYRIRRVPAARAHAQARGAPGLRFPWESADDGCDVTPISALDIDGTMIPILTGTCAEHINSDIAWSIDHYLGWTGDTQVLADGAGELIIGTAEYLAARARIDAHGAAHLDSVIGPDEYHVDVDDNAYTNGMARWHLRRAAALAVSDPARARRFTQIADALVAGYDSVRRRHEQFAGFSALDEVVISEIAVPPVAADMLLGPDRVRQTQIVKQPDVLMLQHLLPADCPADSLAADLDYYLPRTAHGSSLSPAICAALLARVGRPDEALHLFDIASRLDLDDLTGTTAGGLHLATMGGLWQAVVFGFAGVRPAGDALRVEPRLPTRWDSLTVAVTYRGVAVRVAIDHREVSITPERPIPVVVNGRPLTAPVTVSSPPATSRSGRDR